MSVIGYEVEVAVWVNFQDRYDSIYLEPGGVWDGHVRPPAVFKTEAEARAAYERHVDTLPPSHMDFRRRVWINPVREPRAQFFADLWDKIEREIAA